MESLVAAPFLAELTARESAGGAPLPADVRDQAASCLGVDLSAVSLHVRPLPAELSVLALARGGHVHIDPAAYRPDTEAGRSLLFHELAHVLQQAAGRVAPAGGPAFLLSRELEQEADRIAESIKSGTGIGRELRWLEPLRTGRLTLPRSEQLPALPKISMGRMAEGVDHRGRRTVVFQADRIYAHTNTSGRRERYYSVDDLWTEIKKTAAYKNQSKQAKILGTDDIVKGVLERWCNAPRRPNLASIMTHWWSESQNKEFTSYEDAAIAAIGEAMSIFNRQRESNMAQQVYNSVYIKLRIANFIDALLTWHGTHRLQAPRGIETEQGRYYWYYHKSPGRNRSFYEALRRARNVPRAVPETVTAIADYAMVFRGLYSREDSNTVYRNSSRDFQSLMDGRATHYTVNEGSEWAGGMRRKMMPTGAGPSATTMQVLAMSEYIQLKGHRASPRDWLAMREALAWGLFAFWNRTADKLRGEIHTFHEVMAVAQHYGVPYTTLIYPDEIPTEAALEGKLSRVMVRDMVLSRRQAMHMDDDDDDDDDGDWE